HEGRLAVPGDDIGHRPGLAAAGHAHQRLVAHSTAEPVRQAVDRLRLVLCRLEVGYEPEVGHRSVQVYRRPCQTPSDIGLGGSQGGLPREAPEAAGKGVRALAMSDTTTRNDNAVPVSCVVRFRPEVIRLKADLHPDMTPAGVRREPTTGTTVLMLPSGI